jgi:tetratricopeptide (TPR) repeat protein
MSGTDGDKSDDKAEEKETDPLDLARGDVNEDDLADLAGAIDEIDFAARRTTPECLARLRALSTRLADLVDQVDKGVRKRSDAKQLSPEEEKRYDALVHEGVTAAERGDLERARECLENAVRLDPDEVSGLFNLGVLYGKLGESTKGSFGMTHGFDEVYADKATFCFERVTELDATNAQAWTNLAAIYDVRGETDEAKEALRRALEIDPNEKKAKDHLREIEESAQA